jgi:hypothetical protein
LERFCKIPDKKPNKPSEFIYVIGCNEFVKIGIAGNVRKRLIELQVGNPYPLRLYGHWKAGEAVKEEAALHALLSPHQERGEWFKLPKVMMDRITMKLPGKEISDAIQKYDRIKNAPGCPRTHRKHLTA